MADRIVVLQGGVVQQAGTPEEVYERPANQFVAGFIGSPTMNFLPLEAGDGGVVFQNGAPAPTLDAAARDRLRRSGGGVLGIRPEHFAVAEDGIAAPIRLVEPLGSDTLIHVEIGGTTVVARVDPDLRPKVGETIRLRPAPGKVHLFDAASGQVLL